MKIPAKILSRAGQFLVLLALFCLTGQVHAQTTDEHFLLMYSNDVRAELEPCG